MGVGGQGMTWVGSSAGGSLKISPIRIDGYYANRVPTTERRFLYRVGRDWSVFRGRRVVVWPR
jgi:hypothetical protein